ncbi:MAG: emp24/gp25L/p24 family protein [Candidatus Bathyarchaeia archaeon]
MALFVVGLAEATTTTFALSGGEEKTIVLGLAAEDRVVIQFTVAGEPGDNAVYFNMTFPNGTVVSFGKVGSFSYSFVCAKSGNHVLRFSNAASTQEKVVSLNYEVQHYIFGMPQMLFLTLIVVLVCIVMVAVFVFMGKQR